MQPLGNDNYTSVGGVQTYLDRTLTTNEQSILEYVVPAVSRWIDNTLGTNFDNLSNTIPFGSPGTDFTQLYFPGGYNEISIRRCQQIQLVQAINPYDFSVWYTYSTPLEYVAEPYDYPVKSSLRMKMNEFTGNDLIWPGDEEGIQVTALFTEYDYKNQCYPNDIVLLANHICGIWLQNNQNTDTLQREEVEGHMVMKRITDMFVSDPMVNRVLQSREEVWLLEM